MDQNTTAFETVTPDEVRRARWLWTGLVCAFSMALSWRIRGQLAAER